ncbi:MAG TPA: glycoside hydrolase family 30 beta sandwich domain-containing protein [Solirubrobacteraceae bacterium]
MEAPSPSVRTVPPRARRKPAWRWSGSILTALTLLLGAVAIAASPARAAASERSSRPPAPRLTRAEDRAVSLASVSAVADESLGLVVTVKFKGDIERYLGQGNLTGGLLALVLNGQSSSSPPPTGIVADGGGFAAMPFPVSKRHGSRVSLTRGAVEAFSPDRSLRMLTPGQVNVFRTGNQVILYLGGLGLTQPVGVKLKVFSRNPTAAKHTVPVRTLTASAWQKLVQTKPTGVASVKVNTAQLTVAQLQGLRGNLATVLAHGLRPELRRQQRADAVLKSEVAHYATTGDLLQVSRASLVAALRRGAVGVTHLKTKIAQMNKVIGRVDTLITATAQPPVTVVQTDAGLGQELTAQPGLVNSTVEPQGLPLIDVDDRVRYQQFTGLGAAMTDSSAWLISQLSPSARLALTQALFGSPGVPNALGVPAVHLNFLRVGIGASGAMTVGAPYSYDDLVAGKTDPTLSQFSIAHDVPYIIPALQQALAVNPGLEILANPWSPPAWMKSNDSLDNPNARGTLLSSDYGPLAQYFVKFIQAYESYGVPVDALTPQNEPSSGTVATNYPGLTLPEPDEAQFIDRYLAPALRSAGLDTRIYGNDLSWDSSDYAGSLASGPAAVDLSGIAWHCYFGSPNVMSDLHQTAPGLDQIVSECSPEIRSFGTPEFLISSLRNWASAVSVWSLALDAGGEPVQPRNDCSGCLGPVTIDEQTQAVSFRPEYYQLGQVSAFVQPGAWRIDSPSLVTYGVNSANIETTTAGLDDVAFENPDGSKALVAYNNSGAPISFGVESDGSYFIYTLPGHAMTTFVWR